MKRPDIFIAMLAALVLLASVPAFAQEEPDSPPEVLQLTMQAAIELALERNESGLIAREQVNQAKGLVTENRSAAWPHVTGIAGYEYNIEQPTQELAIGELIAPLYQIAGLPPLPPMEQTLAYKHNWNFTVDVQQNIYTFGRLHSAIRLAKQYVDISEEGSRIADQDVVMEVQDAYYKVILAREVTKVSQENLKLTEDRVANVKAKVKAGIKSRFEELQADAERAAAEPNVIRSETGYQLAKMNLLRVMGLPLDRKIEVVDDLIEAFPMQSSTELVQSAMTERREVALLELQADASHTTGNIYISNMLPFITANMNYTQASSSITDEDALWPKDDDWHTFWTVGAQFVWPIFDGFESYGKIRQYRAEERINRLKKAQALKGIELEITQLAREAQALAKQLSASKESVAVAKEAHDLATIRYDSGLGTQLELSEAMTIWTRARLGEIQTLYELNLTHAKLMRAVGKETL
jgi:outer membrane protein